MAHSIELLFDESVDAAIRRDWAALADAGLPSLAHHRSPTNRPHVTLAAAARSLAGADDSLAETAKSLPVPCRIGAPVVFGRGPVTLVRLIVPSAQLLGLQAEVVAHLARRGVSFLFGHTAAGQWTPHVTLCRRLPADDLPAALGVIGAADVVGRFTGLRRWDGDARTEHSLG